MKLTTTEAHQKMLSLICQKSYREGDFILSSGAKSKFYIDLKPTLLHPEGASCFGVLALDWLKNQNLNWGGVGGLTLGADPMVMAVSLEAFRQGLILPAVMIRKEPKKHGTSRYIEGVENLPRGSPILVLEDVVTTGASALKAIEILKNEGFVPSAVLSVVDRAAGGAEAFRSLGLPFFSLFDLKEISDFYRSSRKIE